MPAETQGVVKLNTGDKLMRMPGMETLVTPDGSGVIVNTRDGASTLSVFGNAKVEYRNAIDSPDFRPVAPGSLPSGFT